MTRLAVLFVLFALQGKMDLLSAADLPVEDGESFSLPMASTAELVVTNLQGVVTWIDASRNLLVVQDGSKATPLRVDLTPLKVSLGNRVTLTGAASPMIEAFPDYPDQPTGRDTCPTFEAPTIGQENYLTRMRAFLRPPATGTYTFWIASDDSSELLLSPDASPAHAQKIACVEAGRWTEARQWDRYAGQKSRGIRLKAGEVYYIEAVCQQGWGKDCLAVAWQGPGISRAVIDGQYLSPWTTSDAGGTNGLLREIWGNFYTGDLSVLQVASESVLKLISARLVNRQPAELPAPLPVEIGQVLTPGENFRRVSLEGRLSFFSRAEGQAELELAKGSARVRVLVRGELVPPPDNWLVRVVGVCEARRNSEGELEPATIWVNGPNDVVWSEIEENWSASQMLPMHFLKPSNPELMAGKSIQVRGCVVGRESTGLWRLQGDDVFHGFTSDDGTNWNSLGPPVEIAMPDAVYVGVAVASHETNRLVELKLDQVRGLSKHWQGADIGRPPLAGSFDAGVEMLVVRGAGNDIWAGADQCYLVQELMKGDGEIAVHVAGINAGSQAKAGVMMRESLDSRSPWAGVMFSPVGRVGLQSRRELGINAAGNLSSQPVAWLKLTRQRQSLLVQIDGVENLPSGKMLDVRGRLAWTNNSPVLTEVHWRETQKTVAARMDEVGAETQAAGGDLRNLPIGDLLATTERAELAGTAIRFRIRGVVTFNGQVAGGPLFFIQDDSGPCLVRFRPNVPLEAFPPGRLLELTGVVSGATNSVPEFAPHGVADLGLGDLSKPLPYPAAESQFSGRLAGRWVEVSGVVRATCKNGELSVMCANGVLPVRVGGQPTGNMEKYVNASVRLRGVYWPSPTPLLLLPSVKFILINEPAPADAFKVPSFSIAAVQGVNLAPQSAHRLKIAGVVTCLRQNVIFVQDETGGMRVEVNNMSGFKVGETVEAVGFLVRQAFGPMLQNTIVRRTGTRVVAAPGVISLGEAMETGNNRLVTLEATLLERHSWRGMQILDLQSGQRAFRAVLPLWAGDLSAIASGSRLRLTGVSLSERSSEEADLGEKPITTAVELQLRAPEDVVVLQRPPWWNWKYTAATIGFLAAILIGSLAWIRTLRRRVEQRTHELRDTMGKLQRETQISATLAERDRLAGEIHDSVEQGLSAIMMQMEAATKLVDQPEEIRRYLKMAKNMAGHSRAEVQQAVWDLQSPLLENSDLVTALRRVAQDIGAGDSPLVKLEIEGSVITLASTVEHHLLRIAQEAITNAVKHGNAKHILLKLTYAPDTVNLLVCDDGSGFSPEVFKADGGHFGLHGMQLRARKIGAEFQLQSASGQGTRIQVSVRLEHPTSDNPELKSND